jgi:sulfide:quinone oxidoreductase
MFANNKRYLKNFFSQNRKHFAFHSKLIIIGAGTAGITTATQLRNFSVYKDSEITIFDPSNYHYYQPGFTKIAGIPNKLDLVKKSTFKINELAKGFNFQNKGVEELDPDNNSIIDEDGNKWTYDQLVISCGIKVNLDSIQGNLNLIFKDYMTY